jgi:hypothetical protein
MPLVCLNKDIFSSKLKVIREGKVTRGVKLSIFMQGTFQSDVENSEIEILFNDSAQVTNNHSIDLSSHYIIWFMKF